MEETTSWFMMRFRYSVLDPSKLSGSLSQVSSSATEISHSSTQGSRSVGNRPAGHCADALSRMR